MSLKIFVKKNPGLSVPGCLKVSWPCIRTTKTKRVDSYLQPRYDYTHDVPAVRLLLTDTISGTDFDGGELFDTGSTIDPTGSNCF